MGFAVSYNIMDRDGTNVKYCYGLDFDNLVGAFKIDLHKVKGEINKENEKDVYLDLVNPCDGEKDGCPLLGMAFVKILRYYQEYGTYPEKGGHYS